MSGQLPEMTSLLSFQFHPMKSRILCFSFTVLTCTLVVLLFLLSQKNSNFGKSSPNNLQLQNPLTFLHGKDIVQPLTHIKRTQLIQRLKSYLKSRKSKQILLVIANKPFETILLNWLVAAHSNANIKIQDILILSLDTKLHSKLLKYGMVSIYIPTGDLIQPSAKLRTSHSHLWIIRCMIARILNYWGFDVMMFDIDAVILKDPRPLFNKYHQSDIVASQGQYPFELSHVWGMTLCMGVVLIRSTLSTELFWSNGYKIKSNVQDDQAKVNHILYSSEIKWYTSQQCNNNVQHCTVTGVTKNNSLVVTLLSHDIICRSCDNANTAQYYVMHIRSSRKSSSKERKARQKGAWFLSRNWKTILQNTNSTGNDLLKQLLDTNVHNINK